MKREKNIFCVRFNSECRTNFIMNDKQEKENLMSFSHRYRCRSHSRIVTCNEMKTHMLIFMEKLLECSADPYQHVVLSIFAHANNDNSIHDIHR